MPARSLPRPTDERVASPQRVYEWLEYLCLNSSCRGLGGHELSDAMGLVMGLSIESSRSGADPVRQATAIRAGLRSRYVPHGERSIAGDAELAKLHLLGLSPVALAQPRAVRRQLAADAMGMPVDTFQRGPERDLLLDVANDLWSDRST